MPVNMKGWKVVYKDQVFTCLTVDPMWDHGTIDEDGVIRPDILRVSVIDHYARFMIIEARADRFKFLKESPNE